MIRLRQSYQATVRAVAPSPSARESIGRTIRMLDRDAAAGALPASDDGRDFLPPTLRCWTRRVPSTGYVVVYMPTGSDVTILALKLAVDAVE